MRNLGMVSQLTASFPETNSQADALLFDLVPSLAFYRM